MKLFPSPDSVSSQSQLVFDLRQHSQKKQLQEVTVFAPLLQESERHVDRNNEENENQNTVYNQFDNKITQHNYTQKVDKQQSLPKRYRNLKIKAIDRQQILSKISLYNNFESSKFQNQQTTQTNYLQNQFIRSNPHHQRRSLHLVPTHTLNKLNERNKDLDIFLFRKAKRQLKIRHDQERDYQNNHQSQTNISRMIATNNNQEKFNRTRVASLHDVASYLYPNQVASHNKKSQYKSLTQREVLFNQPERNSQRMIVLIRTYILSAFQSISVEMALLNGSLIVTGKLIGQQNETLKLVLNQEKTQRLIKESFDDWQVLGKRIYVQTTISGAKQLKIAPIKETINDLIRTTSTNDMQTGKKKEERRKQQIERQRQFIKRNYYSIGTKTIQSRNHQSRNESTKNKDSNQSTINHQQKKNDSFCYTKKSTFQGPIITNPIRNNLFTFRQKHLNYMSPEMKDKVNKIKQENQKNINKEQFQFQKTKRQQLIKKQYQLVERLSKSKQPLKPISPMKTKKQKPNQLRPNSIENPNIQPQKFMSQNAKQKSFKKIKEHQMKNQIKSDIEITSSYNSTVPNIQVKLKSKQFILQEKSRTDKQIKMQGQMTDLMQIKKTKSVQQLVNQKPRKQTSKSNVSDVQKTDQQYDYSFQEENYYLQSPAKEQKSNHTLGRKESEKKIQNNQKQKSVDLKKSQKTLISKDKLSSLPAIQKSDIAKNDSDQYENLIQDADESYENSYEQFRQSHVPMLEAKNNQPKRNDKQQDDSYQLGYEQFSQEKQNQQQIDEVGQQQAYENEFDSGEEKIIQYQQYFEQEKENKQIQEQQYLQEEFIE